MDDPLQEATFQLDTKGLTAVKDRRGNPKGSKACKQPFEACLCSGTPWSLTATPSYECISTCTSADKLQPASLCTHDPWVTLHAQRLSTQITQNVSTVNLTKNVLSGVQSPPHFIDSLSSSNSVRHWSLLHYVTYQFSQRTWRCVLKNAGV